MFQAEILKTNRKPLLTAHSSQLGLSPNWDSFEAQSAPRKDTFFENRGEADSQKA
jgi:hypothetical protein